MTLSTRMANSKSGFPDPRNKPILRHSLPLYVIDGWINKSERLQVRINSSIMISSPIVLIWRLLILFHIKIIRLIHVGPAKVLQELLSKRHYRQQLGDLIYILQLVEPCIQFLINLHFESQIVATFIDFNANPHLRTFCSWCFSHKTTRFLVTWGQHLIVKTNPSQAL